MANTKDTKFLEDYLKQRYSDAFDECSSVERVMELLSDITADTVGNESYVQIAEQYAKNRIDVLTNQSPKGQEPSSSVDEDWGDGFRVVRPADEDFRKAGYTQDDVEDIITLDNGIMEVEIGGKRYLVTNEDDKKYFLSQKKEEMPIVTDQLQEGVVFVNSELVENKIGENYYYSQQEINELKSDIHNVSENYIANVLGRIKVCGDNLFSNLLEETKNQLKSVDSYITEMQEIVGSYRTNIQSIHSNVKWGEKNAQSENEGLTGAVGTGKFKDVSRNSSHGSGNQSTNSTDPNQVTETPIDTSLVEQNQMLISAALGLITFTEIVPMYTTLGNETTENSVATTTYGLIGVEKYNGTNYYKIIDKTTGKIYYVEINDKVKFEGDKPDVLEIKSPTIRYDTTQIDNENNNAKLITEGIYLVTGKETVEDGITFEFAKVIDSTDGKNYYFQIDENVETTPLDNFKNESAK